MNLVIAAAGGAGAAAVEAAVEPAAQRRKLLPERETAVLRRLSLGESNKEVARELRITPSTVRTHVESIFPEARVLDADRGDAERLDARVHLRPAS